MSDSWESITLPVLTRAGLPVDADLLYRALLLYGPLTETLLARRPGMPQARVPAAPPPGTGPPRR
ncbi:hypothetical protein [Nonomuraea typhae]|uniref:Uncharacterized protein n=1 Tax=Nonomuraea typhae TaxID=2603600 RepID=A0ABW7Z2Q1_9ACTN